MILPFLQVVVPEVKRLSRAISVHDPHRRDARWWRVTIEDVWDYGLRVSGDRRPDGVIKGERAPELLAADVEYPGPPAELVDLLEKVELLEVRPASLRVKGVAERYGPAWDAQKRRHEGAVKGAKARWNHAPGIATADAKTKTKKETEMEMKERDLRSRSAGEPAHRQPSWQQDAKAQFARLRDARLAELGIEDAPDEDLAVPFINARLKPVGEALGGPSSPDFEERFSRLVSRWLDRASPQKATPPYPFRMFAAPNVWGPVLEEMRGAA